VDNLITVRGKVYIPPTSPLDALANAHGCGHEGTAKTPHRLQVDFFIPGTRSVVAEFVKACVTC
jgi:hypothetical protein